MAINMAFGLLFCTVVTLVAGHRNSPLVDSNSRCGLAVQFVSSPALELNSPLHQLSAAAVRYRIAVGPQAGRKTMTLRDPGAMVDDTTSSKPFTAARDGFSINAAVGCEAGERGKLERLCRYMARPPIAEARLSVTGTTTGTVNSEQPGFNISGAFGRYLDDIKVIRLEGEVLYYRSNISNISGTAADGNLSNASLMFNAFYDFNTDSNWTPFIGGGIGYARVSFENLSTGGATRIDDSGDAFAWQFRAGVSYQLSRSVSINGSYRLYGTDNLIFKDPTNASVTSEGMLTQGAEFGVRFHF